LTTGFKKGKKFIPTSRKKGGISSGQVMGYNVKLRRKDVMHNTHPVVLKNGRHAIAGIGSDGTKMFKFVKAP